MRAPALTFGLCLLAGLLVAPLGEHLPLDPDEPIAADGSMVAGGARTLYDTEPLMGDPPPAEDPDDPLVFAAYLRLEQPWIDRSRDAGARVVGPVDWSLCDEDAQAALIAGLRTYYDARGRQKASFALRGPQARAFSQQVWSTPVDQRIDEFAREAVAAGFLQARELPRRSFPEFARVIAGATPLGKTCPQGTAQRR